MTDATDRAAAIAAFTAPGEPYEITTETIRGLDCRVFVNAPPTLRDLFAETASDLEFIVYDDERLTFAEAWALAGRIGHVLVERCGVAKGDRVAVSMRNYPEWILGVMAATSIGAVAVAMNALWRSDEMHYGLSDSGAKVLLADAERLERLAGAEPLPGLTVIAVRTDDVPAGVLRLDDLLAEAGDVPLPPADIHPDDDATIFYTSGSTGHPKGVVSSHRNVLHALLSWELEGQVAASILGTPPAGEDAPQQATLLAVPLFHATGSHAVWLMSYRLQRRVVCMYKWDPVLAAELIERERVTSVVAPAAMTGDLVRVARETERDLSSLLTVGGGGAPRAPEQVKAIGESFETALPNTGWGMTETNAIGTTIGGEDYLAHPESSGRCSAVLDLKVIDEDGVEVPVGERGELLIRGTSVFRGYWNRPEVDAEVFLPGGWFRTGDVARIDAEGYLYIVDRIKDLIIRGGENIGCGEVEAALLEHGQVLEAAVYAVPDERLGEEVGATCYVRGDLEEDALRAFLRERIAAFKVPRYLRLVSEPLPRTASGKILKRELAAG